MTTVIIFLVDLKAGKKDDIYEIYENLYQTDYAKINYCTTKLG